MSAKRGVLAAAAAAAVVGMACTTEARLNIALHDPSDPAPKRLEVGAQIAGLCLGFLLSWSNGDVRPTARF